MLLFRKTFPLLHKTLHICPLPRLLFLFHHPSAAAGEPDPFTRVQFVSICFLYPFVFFNVGSHRGPMATNSDRNPKSYSIFPIQEDEFAEHRTRVTECNQKALNKNGHFPFPTVFREDLLRSTMSIVVSFWQYALICSHFL